MSAPCTDIQHSVCRHPFRLLQTTQRAAEYTLIIRISDYFVVVLHSAAEHGAENHPDVLDKGIVVKIIEVDSDFVGKYHYCVDILNKLHPQCINIVVFIVTDLGRGDVVGVVLTAG